MLRIKLFSLSSIIFFTVMILFSQAIIDGTASQKQKRELLINMKLHGPKIIQKELEEFGSFDWNLTPQDKLRRMANSPYGANIREVHLKPSTIKTITKRNENIDNAIWCGYIAPTSASGTPTSNPDLGRGWVKFTLDDNLPKVKAAYLNILWAIGNLHKLEVYAAKKEITNWSSVTYTDSDPLGTGKKIDVTQTVQNWLDHPEENYGLILVDSRGSYQYNNYPGTWHNTLGDHITIPPEGIELDIIFDLDPMFPPTYIPGTDLGYYIWKDSNGWHLRMSGGGYGYPHTFEGYFVTDDTFLETNGVELETDTDTLTLDVHRISFKFYVDGEEDGIDFKTSGSNPVKFYINLDGAYQKNYIYVGRFKQHPDLYPLILQ